MKAAIRQAGRCLRYMARTSPVVQWLRICLPTEGMWVQSLVWELRSHMPWGATKPTRGNY